MEIRSPAKINLFLEIRGRRPDGYHLLRSLMCPISLEDTVYLHFEGQGIRIRCNGPGIPEDESNLAWRAAAAFDRALRDKRKGSGVHGLRIELEKRIPAGGGLGGGSSNAAAVLLGLNHRFENPFSMRELSALAVQIGADVPFFLLRRPALATGIGDRLQPVEGLAGHPLILLYPGFPIRTADVYGNLNLALTKCEKRLKNFAFRERMVDVARYLCNDLETAVLPGYPEIAAAKEALMKSGALGALMAGSGSCVFGLFAHNLDARRALDRLSTSPKWQTYLADMIV